MSLQAFQGLCDIVLRIVVFKTSKGSH